MKIYNHKLLALASIFISWIFIASSANAQFSDGGSLARPIATNVATNEINVDSKFNGADIFLFGAKGDVGDILIIVKGPSKSFFVRKKQKTFGIWVDGQRVRFDDVLSYYSMFSTISNPNQRNKILEDLGITKNTPKSDVNFDTPLQTRQFLSELESNLEHEKLYSPYTNKIEFFDNTLFKTSLTFPKNTPHGVYIIEIYFISGSDLVSFQSIPIYVHRVGTGATMYRIAHEYSALYGLCAVAIAVLVGFSINYIFKKVLKK